MVAKIPDFVKAHLDTVLMIIIAMLFVMLAFAAGYTIAKWHSRAPIIITTPN